MNTHAEYLELSAFEELFEDVQLSGIFPIPKHLTIVYLGLKKTKFSILIETKNNYYNLI
jgi:hypothetical protein